MILHKEIKPKACAICRGNFTPYKTTDRVCSLKCSILLQAEKEKAQQLKNQYQDKKASEVINIVTRVFNRYIRLRDKGSQCITCPTILPQDISKFDAGHCFSTGAYPELRYNIHNVNGQCRVCNQDKGGEYETYRENLPARIGQDEYDALELLKNKPRKYQVYELEALRQKYTRLYAGLRKKLGAWSRDYDL